MLYCHETKPPVPCCFASLILTVLFASVLLCACSPTEEGSAEPAAADTYFPIQLGESVVHLQLALSPAEQQKGLMFRKSMPKDHGMLFLSQRPREQSFWMKNTSLPLDIGYFDAAGKLKEVRKLFPFDETPVASRSKDILIAIETNRDWYTNNQVSPGAQLDMAALKAAIIARGFPVGTYAFED